MIESITELEEQMYRRERERLVTMINTLLQEIVELNGIVPSIIMDRLSNYLTELEIELVNLVIEHVRESVDN